MTQALFKQILTSQIPIAWIAGVRLESFDKNQVQTYVEFDFLNQNPFQSMFWAVQGMAAEFSGGMMLLNKVQESGANISTLVVHQESTFTKKAVGKIVFTCSDGELMDEKIKEAIETQEGVTFQVSSVGTDEEGDVVAKFLFTWSIKARSKG
ncbi:MULTISPECIES: YiiD C-terminal domain-containing protein [Weeksella]|uniref:Thioesterase n=1 Tax=Weeksella virosa (strain ATCC 43766 / DSM 16922 / JCM 21250 / CCUG 30538 / CDC 9751 / IAM 14551 / NBRC 16016 / NCTC 11634 / CL345/78) TaxID=865938 RepID=F0NZI4_WEEVC|nr:MULTISPECIES: YiiD C-terminal domain-containing protein [Weeksella]ADX68331.1 hypothetical protein Weevi_1633 [Weeksella virosa DSM 16922]MDK7374561.1 YiiD C-terminal domain-containing protein [Weeksella virosa]MDK7674711.1 YiiD C-terminal domain-containing protein [Weeksella virosa]OFM83118.1 thioesterase [Weeksella sp. HMSC059D05]SUP54650.1 Uncharacterised protein [Weeksella virosa]